MAKQKPGYYDDVPKAEKASQWPIKDIDVNEIDPDGIWLPQDPSEADPGRALGMSLSDEKPDTNVSKDYDPSDKFKVKDDEYLNKEPSEKMHEATRAEQEAQRAKRIKTLLQLKAKGLSTDEIFNKVSPGLYRGSRSKIPAAFRGRASMSRRELANLLRKGGEEDFANEFEADADAYNARKAAEEQARADSRAARDAAEAEVRKALPKNPISIMKLLRGIERMDMEDGESEMANRLYNKVQKKLSPEAAELIDPEDVLDVFMDMVDDFQDKLGSLFMKESHVKEDTMTKLQKTIREAIADVAIETRDWEPDELDLEGEDDIGGVTEVVLDDAAIEKLSAMLDIDPQTIRDCALAAEEGAYSYEMDGFTDTMTDTLMMPVDGPTDWDDTEDSSFNSDFMESAKKHFARIRTREGLVNRRSRYSVNYDDMNNELSVVDTKSKTQTPLDTYWRMAPGGKDAVEAAASHFGAELKRGQWDNNPDSTYIEFESDEDPTEFLVDRIGAPKVYGDGQNYELFDDEEMGSYEPDEDLDFMESRKQGKKRRVQEAEVDPTAPRVDPATAERDNPQAEDTLDAVDTTADELPEYLAYDSSEDDEFAAGLDSFAHTHQPPRENVAENSNHPRSKADRLLTERFYATQERLTEARGGKGAAINDYLDQASNPSYEDFVSWAQQNGVEDIANKYYFNNIMKKRGGVGNEDYANTEPIEPPEPFDPEKAPDELKQLMSLYATASDEDAQVEPSVEQKFKAIYAIGYRTAKGRALKRHAFICGSPGIGKTFTVVRAVEKGANEAGQMFAKFRGSIGKSLSAILAFLWTHRENYVVLLDDADGFLTGSSDEVMNTLKAAMDTDEPLVSSGSPHIRKNVAKMVGLSEERQPALTFDTSRLEENIVTAYGRDGEVLVEEHLTAEERRFWEEFEASMQPKERRGPKKFIESSVYGRIQEGFFDDDEDEEGLGLEDEMEDDDEGDSMLPAQFMFLSRIIFVSNMMQSDIPDYIAGRCNVKELYLTRPEIMERLDQIFPELLKNETAYTPEELTWAKANTFRWMKAVVYAEDMGAPITLASGKQVNVQINVPITFRMFNDFVDGWMQLADENSEIEDLDALEKKIAIQFVSQVILPAFRGDLRQKKKRGRR